MNRNLNEKLFLITVLFCFVNVYFSFFPGLYTGDSYNQYLQSLGGFPLNNFFPPLALLDWKLLGNFCWSPLVLNFVLILLYTSIFHFTIFRNYLTTSIFILIFLFPPIMYILVYAWKDVFFTHFFLLVLSLLLFKNNVKINNRLIKFSYNVLFLSVCFMGFYIRHNSAIPIIIILFAYFRSRKLLHTLLKIILIIILFNLFNRIIENKLKVNEVFPLQMVFLNDIVTISCLTSNKISLTYGDYDFNTACNDFKLVTQNYSYDYIYFRNHDNFKPNIPRVQDKQQFNILKQVWLSSVKKHLILYLKFKLRYFIIANLYHTYYTDPNSKFDKNILFSQSSISLTTDIIGKTSLLQSYFSVINNKYINLGSLISNKFYNASFYILFVFIIFIFSLINYIKKQIRMNFILFCISLSSVVYILSYILVLPLSDVRYYLPSILAAYCISLIYKNLQNNN